MQSATEKGRYGKVEALGLAIGIGVVRGGALQSDLKGSSHLSKGASKFASIVAADCPGNAKNGQNPLLKGCRHGVSTQVG